MRRVPRSAGRYPPSLGPGNGGALNSNAVVALSLSDWFGLVILKVMPEKYG